MAVTKLRPLKNLGQNFLQDKNIALKIIGCLGDISGRHVIEIGPGMGALTEHLLEMGVAVTAFEIDERAVNYLQIKFRDRQNLSLIHSDIRDVNLSEYVTANALVIGNIPYNITNDIIFWLFSANDLIDRAVLTVQKEVAQRYVATTKTKDYGITTLAMQIYGKAKIEFHIRPTVFYPAPKVTSSVLSIDFTKHSDCGVDKLKLQKLIRASFSQRRKVLSNALKSYLAEFEIEKLSEKYSKKRAEELSLSNFVDLYKELYN